MKKVKERLKISRYLKSYYHLDEDADYQVEVINPQELLTETRFDLGAKLYYIQCQQKRQGMNLAQKLYDAHILAFQDGIVEETGNRSKSGLDCYQRGFEELIDCFANDKYDIDREWIPVDKSGQILDGAHRVACAIYFRKSVKVVCLPHTQGYIFDYRFFLKRGLEKGYAEIMAAIFARYKHNAAAILINKSGRNIMKNLCGGEKQRQEVFLVFEEKLKCETKTQWGWVFYSTHLADKIAKQAGGKLVEVDKLLLLEEKESAQQIIVPVIQRVRLKVIRRLRYIYTAMLLRLKKRLGIPI